MLHSFCINKKKGIKELRYRPQVTESVKWWSQNQEPANLVPKTRWYPFLQVVLSLISLLYLLFLVFCLELTLLSSSPYSNLHLDAMWTILKWKSEHMSFLLRIIEQLLISLVKKLQISVPKLSTETPTGLALISSPVSATRNPTGACVCTACSLTPLGLQRW